MVKKADRKRPANNSKKSKTKSVQQTVSPGMASKRALIVVFTFFVLVAGWLAIHIARTAYERQQYTHAQANLDALYDEIVTAVGKPDKTKDDARCGYVSQEFGVGPRYCGIYKYLAFTSVTKNRAVIINDRINTILEQSADVRFKKFFPSTDDTNERSGLTTAAFGTAGINDCLTDAVFITTHTINDYSSIPNGGFIGESGLNIVLTCSGGIQREYFPVKN